MVEGYGRGPDTMLAHISPDEAALIDHLQGGRRVNPTTGLAEYGLFGKILKGVVRAAAGIGGFMVGGPAGAAAASAAATKLTGGSWKQSLLAGGLAGVGGGLGNMAAGQGFMGGAGAAAGTTTSPLGTIISGSAAPAAAAAAPTGIMGGIHAATAGIGGLGGVGAGLGSLLATPQSPMQPPSGMTPPAPDANITYNPLQPVTREYVPYQGDYSKYGESGGEHNFYRPIKPIPLNVDGVSLGDVHPAQTEFMARGGRVRGYAEGGKARMDAYMQGIPGRDPTDIDEMAYLAALEAAKKGLSFYGDQYGANVQDTAPSVAAQRIIRRSKGEPEMGEASEDTLARAHAIEERVRAELGYARGGRAVKRASMAARIGRIKGPGTTTSDSIPTNLSNNEHVLDAEYVKIKGNGSYDRGHAAIEKEKRKVRKAAGIPAPYKPAAARAERAAKVRA